MLTIHQAIKLFRNWLAIPGTCNHLLSRKKHGNISLMKSRVLVNAPTGCGKTFSVFLGASSILSINIPNDYTSKKKNGLTIIMGYSSACIGKRYRPCNGRSDHRIGNEMEGRHSNGDTAISERQKQKRQMPEVLIITPESLHLFLAQKDYPEVFKSLKNNCSR